MTVPARRALALGAVLLAATALPGCAVMRPAPRPPVKEVLDAMPSNVPSAARREVVLVVLALHAAPLYDTTAIAYRLRAGEIGFFVSHEWADTPARMLQPLAVQVLQATGAFDAVVAAPYFGHAPQLLRLEIHELLADFSTPAPALRLSLRPVLQRGRAVRAGIVSVAEPIPERTPEAVVRTANAATAQALLQVAQFVLAH